MQSQTIMTIYIIRDSSAHESRFKNDSHLSVPQFSLILYTIMKFVINYFN